LASATHVFQKSWTLSPRRPLRQPAQRVAASAASLWQCPRCGARLVSRGLSHACGNYSLEQFLKGASPLAQQLFGRFLELIAACGPYEVAPAKTRVAFMASVRFASVNRVRPTYIDVHLVLPRKVSSPRFRRVERLDKLHVHHLRFTDAGQMDGTVQQWLRQSYLEYGERRWLAKPRGGSRARSGWAKVAARRQPKP
jgi:hypothetical protein